MSETNLLQEKLVRSRNLKASSADHTLKRLVEQLMLFPTNTASRSVRACDVDFELSHANKGVESIQYYDAGEQGKLLVALCEGNSFVGGNKGKKAGYGRLVISQLETAVNDDTVCK
ncbi:TPA: hypothetical protein ACH3X1_006153 [Trebouxia sp. C0004]